MPYGAPDAADNHASTPAAAATTAAALTTKPTAGLLAVRWRFGRSLLQDVPFFNISSLPKPPEGSKYYR
jgi:hypothetical protein